MTHSRLANGIQLTSDHDSRNGQRVRYFIVHHAATTSLAAILSLFAPGGREVSANYALGSDGTLVLAVDEDFSAWTSASWYDDAAITIEVANSVAGGSWPVSDAAFEKLAALIADVATRYGFPITDDTVLTHQELYRRFGESYATACPGDLQRRKAELISRARAIQAGTASASAGPGPAPLTQEEIDDMTATPNARIIRDYVTENTTGRTRTALIYPDGRAVRLTDKMDVTSVCSAFAKTYALPATIDRTNAGNANETDPRKVYGVQLTKPEWDWFFATYPAELKSGDFAA